MHRSLCNCFILLIFLGYVEPAKILFYQSFASKSMKIAIDPFLDRLSEKGHDVTYLTVFQSTKKEKYKSIVPPKLVEAMEFDGGDAIRDRLGGGILSFNIEPFDRTVPMCQAFFDSPEVQDLITAKKKFDLIIIDALASECALGLVHVHQAPFIYYCTSDLYQFLNGVSGLGSNAVYVTGILPTAGFTDFSQLLTRLVNAGGFFIYNCMRRFVLFPQLRNMWSEKVGKPFPDFYEIERNVSLIFLNTHPVAEFPQPYLQNVIEVGGLHLQKPNPLPKDLQDFADGSGSHGFIVVSFGTATNSDSLPEKYLRAFLEAFSDLPQRVIWKIQLNDKYKAAVPKNVLLISWLPQNDLFAHPKCKGFLSHGGKMSLFESIYHAIPIVVVPFFADQEIHGFLAQKEGFGLYMELADVTKSSLLNAVTSIVNKPQYKQTAILKSKLLRDHPIPPLEKAVYWTEWLLRYKTTSHLFPEARKWSIFTFYMLDLFLVLGLILLLPILTFWYIIKCCCCRRKVHKEPQRAKKMKRS